MCPLTVLEAGRPKAFSGNEVNVLVGAQMTAPPGSARRVPACLSELGGYTAALGLVATASFLAEALRCLRLTRSHRVLSRAADLSLPPVSRVPSGGSGRGVGTRHHPLPMDRDPDRPHPPGSLRLVFTLDDGRTPRGRRVETAPTGPWNTLCVCLSLSLPVCLSPLPPVSLSDFIRSLPSGL